jgi:hypothetical protein
MRSDDFGIFKTLIEISERVRGVEDRQNHNGQRLDRIESQLGSIQRKLDKASTWIGAATIGLLILINLPPEISGSIIATMVKLLPGN